jgi:sarcosine oxidase, subunit gamma
MAAEMQLLRRNAQEAIAGELALASRDAVRIELVPFRSVINLRGPATAEFAKGVGTVFGADLPIEPNRWTDGHHRAALWLGPDEWLLIADDGEAQAIQRALSETLSVEPWLSIVDVSHNYTSFLVSGSSTRDLLANGCALDLHPSLFGVGDCVQTLLARSRVLLRAIEDGNAIELWVRNSFAGYTAQWLREIATGFRGAGAAER